jgi:hypothetical protein
MSSSMPDRRGVSLAPVNTLAPSEIRSSTRVRAAAASPKISTAKSLLYDTTPGRSGGAPPHSLVRCLVDLMTAAATKEADGR